MRRMLIVTMLLASASAVILSPPAVAGTKEIRVRAEIETIPTRVLPGIPAIFRVSLQNEGRSAVIVENGAILEAALGDGGFFQLRWQGEERSGMFSEPAGPIRLAAGEHRRFLFGSSMETFENIWFSDTRLCRPGVVRLRFRLGAVVDDNRDSLERENDAYSLLEQQPLTEIVSAVTVLEIEQPKGVDREAWRYLEEAGRGVWCGSHWLTEQAALETILQRWPDSRYAPYAALSLSVGREGMSAEEIRAARIAVLQPIWEHHRSSPIAPLLAIALASTEASQANAVALRDLAKSKELAEAARNVIDKTLLTSPDSWRERLRVVRSGIPKDNELDQTFAYGRSRSLN